MELSKVYGGGVPGANRVIEIRMLVPNMTTRRVRPPRCPVCSTSRPRRRSTSTRTVRARHQLNYHEFLMGLLAAARSARRSAAPAGRGAPDLVDSRVGVIKAITECRDAGDRLFHFSRRPAHLVFTRQVNLRAGGASADRGLAVAKRWVRQWNVTAALFTTWRSCRSTRGEAPFPCVDPTAFAHYSDEQYASTAFLRGFDDDTVRWVPAVDALTGAAAGVGGRSTCPTLLPRHG